MYRAERSVSGSVSPPQIPLSLLVSMTPYRFESLGEGRSVGFGFWIFGSVVFCSFSSLLFRLRRILELLAVFGRDIVSCCAIESNWDSGGAVGASKMG